MLTSSWFGPPTSGLAYAAYVSLIAISILVSTLLGAYWICRDRRLSKVPGPQGNPIVGIGLDLPPNATQKFYDWAKEYGEVYKIRVGWWTWVVLNSPEAIKEVFDKQSVSTSSKLPAPMSELVVGGMRMVTMPYGPKWRRYRTLCHRLLTPKMTESFIPTQMQEIGQLLYDLAFNTHDDDKFRDHIGRTLFSIMMKTVYGRRIDRKDDDDVKYTEQSAKFLGRLVRAGAFLEDLFPPLAKLPEWMQPSRKRALHHAEWILWVKMRMWNTLKEQLAGDAPPPCYAAKMIQTDYEEHGLSDEDLAWIAGGLVEAGSQTSTVTMNNLILFLAGNPEVQKRASDEVRKAVGDSRMPQMGDIPNLPYTFACVKEILRLCPVPPWSLRHFTDADVTYKDIVIPKGTAIVCNTAALHYDPVQFPDPFCFKPERYLGYQRSVLEYAAMPDPYDRDHFTFGAGRRMCPGARFAENNLALLLANVLWAFELRPPLITVHGKTEDAKMDLSDGAFEPYPLRSAKPFKARFVPRGEKQMEVIRRYWEVLNQK